MKGHRQLCAVQLAESCRRKPHSDAREGLLKMAKLWLLLRSFQRPLDRLLKLDRGVPITGSKFRNLSDEEDFEFGFRFQKRLVFRARAGILAE